MIRERRKADGTVVYDVNMAFTAGNGARSSLHLGTYSHKWDAEAVVDEWHRSGIRDKEFLRERAAEAERADRRAAHLRYSETCGCRHCDEPEPEPQKVSVGELRRPRQASGWPSDPVGDLVAARVDKERGAA